MAEEVIVELFPCTFAEGGEWTVPAGSRVVLMLGWGAKNQGLMHKFSSGSGNDDLDRRRRPRRPQRFLQRDRAPSRGGGLRIAYSLRHRGDAFGRRVPSGGWHASGF